jgi:hypothetical protein
MYIHYVILSVHQSFIVLYECQAHCEVRSSQLWESLLVSEQGFQYFSSLPVLHYLQAVLFIKIWTIFMNILYNTL